MHQYWSCICLCLWNVLRARNRRPISMPFTKVSNQLRVVSQVCPVNKYRWVKFCLQREEASRWICSTMFQSRLSTNCQFAPLYVPMYYWNAEYEHLQEAHRTSDHYSRQVSLRVSLSRLTNHSTVWLCGYVFITLHQIWVANLIIGSSTHLLLELNNSRLPFQVEAVNNGFKRS